MLENLIAKIGVDKIEMLGNGVNEIIDDVGYYAVPVLMGVVLIYKTIELQFQSEKKYYSKKK